MGRDVAAEQDHRGRQGDRVHHLGHLLPVRARSLSRCRRAEARHDLSAAGETDQAVRRIGHEARRGRGARSVPGRADQGHGHHGPPRQERAARSAANSASAWCARRFPAARLPCKEPVAGLFMRPPTFCPGCSHRGLYTVLAKLKLHVSGDIGCYTLGALPPFSAMHTCICMGASISAAHGMAKGLALAGRAAEARGRDRRLHVPPLRHHRTYQHGLQRRRRHRRDHEQRHHGHDRRTGACGHGPVGQGAEAPRLDIAKLCQVLGAKRVREIDAYQVKELEKIMKEELALHRAHGPYLEPALRAAVPGLEEGLCRGAQDLRRVQGLPQGRLHRAVLHARRQDRVS